MLSNASPAEGHIVRAGRVLGGVPRHALVVRVVGHQVPSVHVGRQLGKYLYGVLKNTKYSYHKRSVHDHLDKRLGLRLDSVVKVGLLHGNKVVRASSHFPAISSYPQQMIVLRGSVIHNLVQVREVSVQINIVGIVSADQIVFGSLKSTINNQLQSCRAQT